MAYVFVAGVQHQVDVEPLACRQPVTDPDRRPEVEGRALHRRQLTGGYQRFVGGRVVVGTDFEQMIVDGLIFDSPIFDGLILDRLIVDRLLVDRRLVAVQVEVGVVCHVDNRCPVRAGEIVDDQGVVADDAIFDGDVQAARKTLLAMTRNVAANEL